MFVFKLNIITGAIVYSAFIAVAMCISGCGDEPENTKVDEPLVNVPKLTLDQIVRLTNNEIVTEIRMPLPKQRPDEASATEAINKARDWYTKMDTSDYACYRTHRLYKEAISLSSSEMLSEAELEAFQNAEDKLIEELTSTYQKVIKLLEEKQFTLADESLTRIQVSYPEKDSILFKNTMKLKWYIKQQS